MGFWGTSLGWSAYSVQLLKKNKKKRIMSVKIWIAPTCTFCQEAVPWMKLFANLRGLLEKEDRNWQDTEGTKKP